MKACCGFYFPKGDEPHRSPRTGESGSGAVMILPEGRNGRVRGSLSHGKPQQSKWCGEERGENLKKPATPWFSRDRNGEGGIRTHGTVTRTTVFEF